MKLYKYVIIQATPTQEIFKDLHEWLSKNSVEIPISKSFSINDFKEAYHFTKKGGVGKVVITVQ